MFKQYPDIEILGSANASWDYAQGKAAMESMLSAYPEIDGVWSQGGAMTQRNRRIYSSRPGSGSHDKRRQQRRYPRMD